MRPEQALKGGGRAVEKAQSYSHLHPWPLATSTGGGGGAASTASLPKGREAPRELVPGRELVPWTGDGTGGISQGLKLQTHKEPRNRDERSVVHAPPSGKPPIRAVVIGQRQ